MDILYRKWLPLLMMLGMGSPLVAQLLPLMPETETGKCYDLCLRPENPHEQTTVVELRETGESYERVPPRYDSIPRAFHLRDAETVPSLTQPEFVRVSERVMIREAHVRLDFVAAVYDTIRERVLIAEGYTGMVVVPAIYDTLCDRIKISDETIVWEEGEPDPDCVAEDPSDCRRVCMTILPARYKRLTRYQQRSPAHAVEQWIPPRYEFVDHLILKKAATYEEVEVQAEYDTIYHFLLKEPGAMADSALAEASQTVYLLERKSGDTVRSVEVPAIRDTVLQNLEQREFSILVWKEVICPDQLTQIQINRIQNELRDLGYDPGPKSGILTPETWQALRIYQRDHDLPVGKLDIDTMRNLEVL